MLPLEKQNAWREVYRATHPGWRPATELFADQVRAHLRPDARLLDLGCGRGGLVEQLEPTVAQDSYPVSSLGSQVKKPVPQVIGIDPDFASLRQHRLPALPRAAARSDRLPFPTGRFDVVAASWLLEHLAAPAATLAEVARVLRPGGAFVFITPNARHPLTWANRAAGQMGRAQGRLVARLYGRVEADTFPTAYRANTAAALAALASAAGLALTDLRAVADPTYLAFSPTLYRVMTAIEERLPAGRGIHLVGVATR